tara:strand:+ start:523 stop:1074 length:552 start_codon:yes stop_codon:yes gene_type:complete
MLHAFNKENIKTIPTGYESIFFGMGCFWGAEKIFWNIKGVHVTCVGYAGGQKKYPSYEEVCSGTTNHAEVVKVVYNPEKIKTIELLINFWEGHDPTQGMRQGNDIGSQYRSMIITSNQSQKENALSSKVSYETELIKRGFNKITTEILDLTDFYYAEEYHQQYLFKNPHGYCGLGGCGITFKK